MDPVNDQEAELAKPQIQGLQSAQLVAYAEDLNRTYLELRKRLQQMTALSGLTTRLARVRNVEAATRSCVDGVPRLFRQSVARLYTEDRRGAFKATAERAGEPLGPHAARFDSAAEVSRSSKEPVVQHYDGIVDGEDLHVAGVALRARARAFGALVVGRSADPFTQDDLNVLELLGNNTAAAMENARLYQATRSLATRDATTGLFNFRYFHTSLAQEIQKAKRFRYPIGMLMADLDFFKRFNDTYGHPKGNIALRKVAQAMLKSLRQTDTVARFGGEEFAAILPGCDRASLYQVAEKVRESVAQLPIRVAPGQKPTYVTVSIGGAWQDAAFADARTLVAAADEALYTAKAQGRDRTAIRP
jgi:diguanylate cyclase (GGDEF)-like protein